MPYQFRSMTVAVMVRVLLVTGWIAVSPIAVHATRDWRNEAEWHIRQVMADSRSPGRVLVAKHAVRKMIAGEAVVWGEGMDRYPVRVHHAHPSSRSSLPPAAVLGRR